MIWFMVLVAVVIVGIGAFLIYASFNIDSGVYVEALCKGDTKAGCLAYVRRWAGWPLYAGTIGCTESLSGACLLFCIGQKVTEHPEIVRRMWKEGHLIGTHSDTHSWKFPFYSKDKMLDDLMDALDPLSRLPPVRHNR